MRVIIRWLRFHQFRVLAFATMVGAAATTAFVWYIWSQFEIKSRALARAGSEASEYMGIATTVLGSWILPALVGVSFLTALTFLTSLRRSQPTLV